MDKVKMIIISGIIALLFYLTVKLVLLFWKAETKEYIRANPWLHPNSVSVWRTLLAFFSDGLYFGLNIHFLPIIMYTISAVMDGIDGLFADHCDLHTETGKELDPLCDKLTYLPPLIGFAYLGYISLNLTLLLTGIEFLGQLLRRLMHEDGYLMAATIFGKIKANFCFILVIYCAILNGGSKIGHYGNYLLVVCVLLAITSIISKMPIRKYIRA